MAISFSGVAVPANSRRAGGSVAEALGTGTAPGLPAALAPGAGVVPVMRAPGGSDAAADEVDFADAPPLAAGEGAEAAARVMGGGVAAVSSSATARRYLASFSPEFQRARPNSPSRYCEATSRGMSSSKRG